MVEEDELRLPYLVFQTWRNYYVKLQAAYRSFQLEDYALTRRQLHQARKWLIESKAVLLQRGMAVDDDWISELEAMILDNLELVESLVKGEYDYMYRYMGASLDMTEIHREKAAKKL